MVKETGTHGIKGPPASMLDAIFFTKHNKRDDAIAAEKNRAAENPFDWWYRPAN